MQNEIVLALEDTGEESFSRKLQLAVPKWLTAERMIRLALSEFRKTPKLLQCTKESVLNSILQMGQLGLEPGPLGHAWLVPFKRECTLMLGYRGLAVLAYRSDKLAVLYAEIVREGDVFRHSVGTDPRIEHVPVLGNEGEVIAAYAVARMKSNALTFTVMSRADLDQIRRRSRSAREPDSPWNHYPGEMQKKTALRRLAKYLPCDVWPPEAFEALAREDAAAYPPPDEGQLDTSKGRLALPDMKPGDPADYQEPGKKAE